MKKIASGFLFILLLWLSWMFFQPPPLQILLFESNQKGKKSFQSLSVAKKKKILSQLIQNLNGTNPDFRWRSAWALSKIGKEAHTAIPHLIKALSTEAIYLQKYSILALGKIGPAAKEATPLLMAFLEKDLWETHELSELAALALGEIGKEAQAAIPILLETTLLGSTWMLKDRAAWSLSKIDPKQKIVVPKLLAKIANEKNETFRLTYQLALKRVLKKRKTYHYFAKTKPLEVRYSIYNIDQRLQIAIIVALVFGISCFHFLSYRRKKRRLKRILERHQSFKN